MEYLSSLTDEMIKKYHLQKILYVRKETIYIKHVLKKFFLSGQKQTLSEYVNTLMSDLNMSLFEYIAFISNRLNGINNVNRYNSIETPSVLTNLKLKDVYESILSYIAYHPIILISENVIDDAYFKQFFLKYCPVKTLYILGKNNHTDNIKNFCITENIHMFHLEHWIRKDTNAKYIALKEIATTKTKQPIFYFDNDVNCLERGLLLTMHTYKVDNGIKLYGANV